ncbi:MAG TPA: UDP-N-acetylglucosamine 2-epimerase (non-hydrolyzing) [Patescibacteria group bacterium]|nr:UDP-N-acetylglucosamine 2-epimerase (non-hydrolyzing) [Patescibacteria group bacterium]
MENQSNKLKVMTIFGTRPEIIRLSRIMIKLDKYVNHIMVHTGQSYDYEMNEVFFKDLDLRKPDHFLGVKSDTIGGQIANLFLKGEPVIKAENPDAILILGDTNSALLAILAKRFKIPIFHLEAGNRCFDENVPEETNRKIVDHISDINLPYTEHSRRYLIGEGVHPGTIYVTGTPLREVFESYQDKVATSNILMELNLTPKGYFLVSAHREENVENNNKFQNLIDSLNAIAMKYNQPVIVTTHPRTRKRLEQGSYEINDKINFAKPFGYLDYIKLQQNARCVITDSGSIQEEAAIIGFNAVQIRTVSERPEAFETGNVILAGVQKDGVLLAIDTAIRQVEAGEKFQIPNEYKESNVSGKVVRLIIGLAKIIKDKKYD